MMKPMNKIDHLDIDGHALTLFLAVLEEGSVTAAAERLDLTQSAVSHSLQKLRRILGDPLFVKSGRGIVATAHALTLAARARSLIDSMEAFARTPDFDPRTAHLSFTIAANDFQAELLLPRVYRRLAETAGRVNLRIVPSGAPTPDLLRDKRCDLILSPLPPEGTDIVQRRLFEDRYACFHDAAVRAAPVDIDDFLAAEHVLVVHSDHERLEFDRRLEDLGIRREAAIRVSGFAGVPSFLRGTAMLATLPSLLGRNLMRGFASGPVPRSAVLTEAVCSLPMYMAWHQRDQLAPAHLWLRTVLAAVAQEAARGPSEG